MFTMPSDLLKTYKSLDAAVDAAYGKRPFTFDADRVAFLFERYLELTKAPLEIIADKSKREKRRVS